MIPGDLLSAFPHRQFHTLPGLLDSWAALPNSNPNACVPRVNCTGENSFHRWEQEYTSVFRDRIYCGIGNLENILKNKIRDNCESNVLVYEFTNFYKHVVTTLQGKQQRVKVIHLLVLTKTENSGLIENVRIREKNIKKLYMSLSNSETMIQEVKCYVKRENTEKHVNSTNCNLIECYVSK